jgi:phosphate starvation-inducible protein PhoH and related proteins
MNYFSQIPNQEKTESDWDFLFLKNNALFMSRNTEIVSRLVDEGIEFTNEQFAGSLLNGKVKLKCKNRSQKEFSSLIDENQIVLCKGPAGVGKSFVSIVKALELLKTKGNGFNKIIIITPVVESEEKIGYLKGTLEEKLDPYLFSTYYLIDKIIGEDLRKRLIKADIIKPLAIAYLRGVNIDNSIVIFEEAQNSTKKAMKTFLTRIGFNTKFIVSGDIEQIDRFRNEEESGLKDALDKLKSVDGVGIMEFTSKDIVRNPIISKILEKY